MAPTAAGAFMVASTRFPLCVARSAASAVASSRSRPITLSQSAPRACMFCCICPTGASGTHTSAVSGTRKSAGMTPTTSYGEPLSDTDLPRTLRSPPKRLCQTP